MAALATIAVYEEDGLIERAKQMGGVLGRHHRELMDRHVSVGAVRNIGLFGTIEHPVQGLGHAGEVQFGEQGVNGRAHQSPSASWKKAPHTCLRISDSRRVRS